jgi:hypothetical protein
MSHRRLLGHRLALHVRLRQLLALMIVFAAIIGQQLLHMEGPQRGGDRLPGDPDHGLQHRRLLDRADASAARQRV